MTELDLHGLIRQSLDSKRFQDEHWEGSFQQYLELLDQNPLIVRTAHQRLYDMVLSYGQGEVEVDKEKVPSYKFFTDPVEEGRDAVFGLERSLHNLMAMFKAAAHGFGPERRVLLLHGPVGSSKSTIVRLLKKGLEAYSRTAEGALYTFSWKVDGDVVASPMNEEPLLLLPREVRQRVLGHLQKKVRTSYKLRQDFDLSPVSRYYLELLLKRHGGDFGKVLDHVVVQRLVISEKDRVGVGTFQPKDEKNQDSTELTGDINYRRIAELGTDSDPRAFNFDGEFCVANRGIIEFVEMLKLDVAFLYDLLGASQEHRIKPKKFAQTSIDEVIIGHSVAGNTPILYRHDDTVGWSTLEGLHARFGEDATGLEVVAFDLDTSETKWTPVKSVFRHKFSGPMHTTSQKWGVVETTPNHSIYDREGKVFYPEDRHEVLAVREAPALFAPLYDE